MGFPYPSIHGWHTGVWFSGQAISDTIVSYIDLPEIQFWDLQKWIKIYKAILLNFTNSACGCYDLNLLESKGFLLLERWLTAVAGRSTVATVRAVAVKDSPGLTAGTAMFTRTRRTPETHRGREKSRRLWNGTLQDVCVADSWTSLFLLSQKKKKNQNSRNLYFVIHTYILWQQIWKHPFVWQLER